MSLILFLTSTSHWRKDIRKYLDYGFKRIYDKREDAMHEVPWPWLPVGDMKRLVDKASG